MDAVKLAGLQPQSVFAYFERICSYPHGSGNTKPLSDYLVSFAREQGLRHFQDELNNVVIFADGTCGMAHHEPVILQAHMDMVCVKDAGCPIDLEHEGLDVTHDGSFVYAGGTSLGGDDCIGVAFALALLADRSIPHPPLEVLLTVDEENGMHGAKGLDVSGLRGRRMINLDAEDEGFFTVSCAGGARGNLRLPVAWDAAAVPCVKLTVSGLRGGHSGLAIHKNFANANKLMGQLLKHIQAQLPVRIAALCGGDKTNAITDSCEAVLAATETGMVPIGSLCAAFAAQVRKEYDEPNAVVTVEEASADNALTAASTEKVIALLCEAPHGVQAWSEEIDGLVQTSANFALVRLDDALNLTWSVRSLKYAEREALLNDLKALGAAYGAGFEYSFGGAPWERRKDSPLRDTMVEIYTKMYGQAPQAVAIHAGVECGILTEKIPGLDCLCIGPNMKEIHTPREKLEIASVRRVWEFLLEVLKNL